MGLVTEFRRKNKIYMQTKHSNTTTWQKQKIHRVERFLRFCESYRCKDFHSIKQKHYDSFMQLLVAEQKTPETIRKYSLAIKEFVARAHIKDIAINPDKAKHRRIIKKLNKLVELLKKHDIEISDDKITILLPDIEKIL